MDVSRIEEMALLEGNHYWFWGKRLSIKALLTNLNLSPSSRLLDIGCGTGGLLEDLQDLFNVEGVDPSLQARTFCTDKNILSLPGTAEHLPYDSNQFDVITMSDVLEHVDNDAKAISEAYRVLQPGGYLLITVPAHPFLFGKHDKALEHFRRYTKSQLSSLIELVPFELKKLTYTNPLLFLPALFIQILDHFSTKEQPSTTRNGCLPRPLNELAKAWYFVEANWLSCFSIPFGLSLLCLVQKPLDSK